MNKIMWLLLLVVASIMSLKMYLFPRFKLPDIKGAFGIGEVRLQLRDLNRLEVYTPEPADHRQVMVTIWYPMKETLGETKKYPEEVTSAISSLLGLPKYCYIISGQFKLTYMKKEKLQICQNQVLSLYTHRAITHQDIKI